MLMNLTHMRISSLQAFSLPGSMYLSILGGAVWGMARALPLCCAVRSLLLLLSVSVNAVSYFSSFSGILLSAFVSFLRPLYLSSAFGSLAPPACLFTARLSLLIDLIASSLWLLGLSPSFILSHDPANANDPLHLI